MTRESTLPRSPRTITAVLAISGTLVALMQTLVVPLLPDFPGILGVTADDASWLVTATLLSSAMATPIVSRSADMYGKRKMMVVCMAIMVVGSVLAAVGGSFRLADHRAGHAGLRLGPDSGGNQHHAR